MVEQLSFFHVKKDPEAELLDWTMKLKECFNALEPIINEYMLVELKRKKPYDFTDWEKEAERIYNEYLDATEDARYALEAVESYAKYLNIKIEGIDDGK